MPVSLYKADMIDVATLPAARRKLYSKGYDRWVRFCQLSSHWMVKLLAWLYLGNFVCELERSDLKSSKHYVLVVNHQYNIDPTILLSTLPADVVTKLRTFRVFAHTFFFYNPFNRFILTSLGGFPTKEHPFLPYGLAYAKDQLREGHPVVIFPEGKMAREGRLPAKMGVEVMAQWKKVMLIPVHLEWRGQWPGFRFAGRKVDMHIGKPFSGKGMTAQEILDRVYDLPV